MHGSMNVKKWILMVIFNTKDRERLDWLEVDEDYRPMEYDAV